MDRNLTKAGGSEKLNAGEYALIFLAARLVLIISLSLEGLKSFGDFWNFYSQADLGTPYFDFWTEFPPVFPLFSRAAYLVVGGREHSYVILLSIIFSLIQALNIYFFARILLILKSNKETLSSILLYSFISFSLFYTWAYFDVLAVFCTLWGLLLILEKKDLKAGIVIGAGGLVKWFPLLLLPAAWKWLGSKKALRTVLSSLLVVLAIWGLLFLITPEFTKASLISQGTKGSWETIWALVDGNLGTGNFGSGIDRLDPASAALATGNPAIIPTWITLLIFGGLGLAVFLTSDLQKPQDLVGFIGFTMLVFFLWSPGYSPQWIQFVIPLPLFVFDRKRGWLITLTLVLVSLLEWPILLSRGWFQFLDEIVITRTLIFLLLSILFYQSLPRLKKVKEEVDFAGK